MFWAFLLLLVGVVLIVLELFLPSGGLLGIFAAGAILASVAAGFYYGGLAAGTLFLALVAAVVPATLLLGIRWWPYTPIGRRILNRPPGESAEEDEQEQADRRRIAQLLGRKGRAKTAMLPAGAIVIDGRTYDAVCRGLPVEAGDPIVVVEVEGNHIAVRRLEKNDPRLLEDESPAADADLLSQPIDRLGIEPLDRPLT